MDLETFYIQVERTRNAISKTTFTQKAKMKEEGNTLLMSSLTLKEEEQLETNVKIKGQIHCAVAVNKNEERP